MSPWAKPQIDAFIRSHAYCPSLDMKDFAREDFMEDPPGAWIKLFCTTCETELPIHLLAAHNLDTIERVERDPQELSR